MYGPVPWTIAAAWPAATRTAAATAGDERDGIAGGRDPHLIHHDAKGPRITGARHEGRGHEQGDHSAALAAARRDVRVQFLERVGGPGGRLHPAVHGQLHVGERGLVGAPPAEPHGHGPG
jgi:hypothetical protein